MVLGISKRQPWRLCSPGPRSPVGQHRRGACSRPGRWARPRRRTRSALDFCLGNARPVGLLELVGFFPSIDMGLSRTLGNTQNGQPQPGIPKQPHALRPGTGCESSAARLLLQRPRRVSTGSMAVAQTQSCTRSVFQAPKFDTPTKGMVLQRKRICFCCAKCWARRMA